MSCKVSIFDVLMFQTEQMPEKAALGNCFTDQHALTAYWTGVGLCSINVAQNYGFQWGQVHLQTQGLLLFGGSHYGKKESPPKQGNGVVFIGCSGPHRQKRGEGRKLEQISQLVLKNGNL